MFGAGILKAYPTFVNDGSHAILLIDNVFSKWSQCKARQFEMLISKRDSYNRNVKENAKHKMTQGDPNTPYEDPNKVEDNVNAPIRPLVGDYFFAKRPQCQSC